MPPLQRTLFLVGPTAAGKSAVGLCLARRLGGEIVSVDSMQVYRGLDLGTAKPSKAEREEVPHHLIDVVGPEEAFDVARFRALALAAWEDTARRGRWAVFCGGTGLYFKALLEGLGTPPPADPALRAELEATPLPALLEELSRRDPATFECIDRHNPRRVVRAIEVIRLTGRPFSEQRTGWTARQTPPPAGLRLVGLTRAPADLRARIDRRVDAMFAAGLIEETRRLLERGLATNRTALQALGYRQVLEHLRGERSLPDTVALVKQKTWQFARRQMTWFRHQLPVDWLAAGPDATPEDLARTIAKASIEA